MICRMEAVCAALVGAPEAAWGLGPEGVRMAVYGPLRKG